jgi:hypothetical protein
MPCTLLTDAEFKLSSVFVGNIYVGVAHSVNDAGVVVNYMLPLMLLLNYCFAQIICHLKEEIVCLLGFFFFLLSGCTGLRIYSLQITPKLAGQNQSFLEICGFFFHNDGVAQTLFLMDK